MEILTQIFLKISLRKFLDKIMKKALCGVCNLSIATGVQNKIFTYMSFGLPTIVSKNCLIENLTKNILREIFRRPLIPKNNF